MTAMSSIKLTPLEEQRAEQFLARKDVSDLIYFGVGSWALVFGPHNGIGAPVKITASDKARITVLTEDITDLENW